LSVDPSSQTITSKSLNVCAISESRQRGMSLARLYVGIITETLGEIDLHKTGT
jgi:hypothetical protein